MTPGLHIPVLVDEVVLALEVGHAEAAAQIGGRAAQRAARGD